MKTSDAETTNSKDILFFINNPISSSAALTADGASLAVLSKLRNN